MPLTNPKEMFAAAYAGGVTVLVLASAGRTTQALTSRKKDKEAAANDGIAE